MKILVISQYFHPENFRINDLCIGLKEKGNDITVLTAKPNYPKGKFFNGYNFFNKKFEKIYDIDVYRSYIIPRGSANKINLTLNYFSFVFFGFFKLFSLKGEFDRVFVFAPSPITVGFVGIFASFLFKCKSFIWVQDLWPESVKDAGGIHNPLIIKFIDFMTRTIYSLFDNILIQSPAFKKYLIAQGVKEKKIIYFPNYAENFYKIEKEDEIIRSKFPSGLKLLFAGNIGVAQSFDTIIEAVRIASTKLENLKIIVLGEGRDKSRVEKKIKEENLQDYFKFLGSHPPESMPFYFASADALMVSLKKSKIFSLTIPSKIQTYLACGKPLIGSLDGIGAKIIKDASSGLVSSSEDSRGLAENIIRFSKLSDEEKLKLSLNSRKFYEAEFEREKLLNKLNKILNQ